MIKPRKKQDDPTLKHMSYSERRKQIIIRQQIAKDNLLKLG